MCAGQIKLGKQLPVLQQSILGWIAAGPTYASQSNNYDKGTFCNLAISSNIQKQLKFWVKEECNINKKKL